MWILTEQRRILIIKLVGWQTCSVDTSQPPSSATGSSFSGTVNIAAIVAGWKLCMGSATWAPTHQGKPGAAVLTAPTANSRDQRWVYGTSPQGDQPATWWQVDYTGPFPSWKGQGFVLTGIAIYSRSRFAFPAETTFLRLTECLFHHPGIPHSVTSDQETHFTANEV